MTFAAGYLLIEVGYWYSLTLKSSELLWSDLYLCMDDSGIAMALVVGRSTSTM